jgi:molecular chaperone IbpA
MSRNDFSRLFDQLEALSIGFGPVFRDLQNPTSNYPPHNIVFINDEKFNLELAVAGFKKSEIHMQEHQGLLTISAEKKVDLDTSAENLPTYQYRGIAGRSFTKSFRIAEYFEVNNATLEDGILTVTFVKNVPDEAKPKLIAIK